MGTFLSTPADRNLQLLTRSCSHLQISFDRGDYEGCAAIIKSADAANKLALFDEFLTMSLKSGKFDEIAQALEGSFKEKLLQEVMLTKERAKWRQERDLLEEQRASERQASPELDMNVLPTFDISQFAKVEVEKAFQCFSPRFLVTDHPQVPPSPDELSPTLNFLDGTAISTVMPPSEDYQNDVLRTVIASTPCHGFYPTIPLPMVANEGHLHPFSAIRPPSASTLERYPSPPIEDPGYETPPPSPQITPQTGILSIDVSDEDVSPNVKGSAEEKLQSLIEVQDDLRNSTLSTDSFFGSDASTVNDQAITSQNSSETLPEVSSIAGSAIRPETISVQVTVGSLSRESTASPIVASVPTEFRTPTQVPSAAASNILQGVATPVETVATGIFPAFFNSLKNLFRTPKKKALPPSRIPIYTNSRRPIKSLSLMENGENFNLNILFGDDSPEQTEVPTVPVGDDYHLDVVFHDDMDKIETRCRKTAISPAIRAPVVPRGVGLRTRSAQRLNNSEERSLKRQYSEASPTINPAKRLKVSETPASTSRIPRLVTGRGTPLRRAGGSVSGTPRTSQRIAARAAIKSLNGTEFMASVMARKRKTPEFDEEHTGTGDSPLRLTKRIKSMAQANDLLMERAKE